MFDESPFTWRTSPKRPKPKSRKLTRWNRPGIYGVLTDRKKNDRVRAGRCQIKNGHHSGGHCREDAHRESENPGEKRDGRRSSRRFTSRRKSGPAMESG